MRYILCALLVGTLLGTGFAHAQVKKEVSDITGVERITSENMRSLHEDPYAGDHASLRAEYVNDPDDGASWILAVYGFATDSTQVSRSNQFVVQADGQQLEPTRLESKTRTVNGTLMEIKRAVFTRSGFEQIARAQTVTISIGSANFLSVRPRREDLRLILNRVPAKGPQTATSGSSDRQ